MSNTKATTTADIEQGAPGARLTLVTPETAERWLDRNSSNRNLRSSHIASIARDMAGGKWQITGEAIKFDTDGNLLDGQHRLSAVVRSGVSVQMLVVSGLMRSSQQVMDSGAKRTAADALALDGRHRSNYLASAARLSLAEELGAFSQPGNSSPSYTTSEIVAFVDLNPDLVEAVAAVAGEWRKVGSSPSAAAAAALRLRRIDLTASLDFFNAITYSATAGPGDPRYTLIERLRNGKMSKERMTPSTEMFLIYKTWNACRDGRQLRQLKILSTTKWEGPR